MILRYPGGKSPNMNQKDIDRFWNFVSIKNNSKCWEWKGYKNPKGYGRFTMGRKKYLSHRFAYFIKNGHFGNNLILHLCDNSSCVNPKHLIEGSALDNAKQRDQRNRRQAPKGSRHWMSKLNERSIIDIRKSNEKQTILAKQYNVSRETISAIKTRRNWSHV